MVDIMPFQAIGFMGGRKKEVTGGGDPVTVDLPDTEQISIEVNINNTARAGWRFESDGTVSDYQGGTYNYDHDWGTPTQTGAGDDFEVRVTKNSGTTPLGNDLNTWFAMSASRRWYLVRSTEGTDTCNLTVEIRDADTETLQDTQTYTIQATYFEDLNP